MLRLVFSQLLLLQAVVAWKGKAPVSESKDIGSLNPAAVCLLQYRAGSCRKLLHRWYYNLTEGECKQFTYSGCDGNGNRFRTQQVCEKVCISPEAQLDDMSSCDQPVDPGPCKASVKRWYYDRQTDECKTFLYGGCNGNSNNFENENECKYTCVKDKEESEPFDACKQPLSIGNCTGKTSRWFFDIANQQCKYFRYSGCGGNANNFMTKRDCEATCLEQLKSFGICGQKPAYGDCGIKIRRWFFNPRSGQCEKFSYSGCGGNSNRFDTKRSCEKRCLWIIACNQKMDPGPCRGLFRKWYFNRDTKKCETFVYGGCQGNMNQFNKESECKRKCIRHDNEDQ
ncbi:hypothetical protein M514_03688 [Trichuris suis]|uniref:BPTI/Kunitz inhibitor domain-containing protein n=1 Tax=Trichuris suis TaxID=68888 RepID=A0A085NGS6_9BILA|nr:hypothetical protein M513_03688 [Trichuris suis]KFD68672.1 hypothetical protein M514_03688 [Trichuris suis]KHJ42597.1 Kunitz/Bovine pancreatic trypsin inhibitor domain protein [Trichuris suis]